MSNYITTDFLNLRQAPVIAIGNVVAVMPPDTVVEEISAPTEPGWRRVKTSTGNSVIEGFASKKYLDPTTLPLSTPSSDVEIPEVHYPFGNRQIKRNGTGRVYPLNESGMPKTDLKQIADVQERKNNIHKVIEFLDVEKSLRYAPVSPYTYCNIYAYDVAYCLTGFLPRVWWTSDAIMMIRSGTNVQPVYDKTITEMTANRIADWFEKYGSHFGWERIFDINTLQDTVNNGRLGILVAQRINMNNPGHIVAVVPENDNHRAKRNTTGDILSPLQSQAGSRNKKYFSGTPWWEDGTRFKKFGFWVSLE